MHWRQLWLLLLSGCYRDPLPVLCCARLPRPHGAPVNLFVRNTTRPREMINRELLQVKAPASPSNAGPVPACFSQGISSFNKLQHVL